jgi:hypothetical protein
MKIIAVILFIFCASDVEYFAMKRANEIPYGKLSWNDFKVRERADNTAAESATSIGYRYDGVSKVQVYCTFNTQESFVTKKGMTPHILRHEQGHFDITYLFAQKLIERLSKEQSLNGELIDAVYDQIILEKEAMQNLYDKETDYSKNKEAQAAWGSKIDKLLK